MNCEYCQSPVHIWFQCPKKPDGWKPARLAKVRIGTAKGPDRPLTPKSDVSASPPSDTKVHTQSPVRRAKRIPGSLPVAAAESNAESTGREPRARPAVTAGETAPKFDKKTWQRNYMRTFMAQYRADVKAGKRVPKKREC